MDKRIKKHVLLQITGCGPLSTKTDCACNVHAYGGHLLCHDDVIGDRRVSFIVYLTDPDDGWTAADGGALELYPNMPGGCGLVCLALQHAAANQWLSWAPQYAAAIQWLPWFPRKGAGL